MKHKGLHCLRREKQFSRTEVPVYFDLEIIDRNPWLCTINHSRLIVVNQMEGFFAYKELIDGCFVYYQNHVYSSSV